jgi:MFS family permease
MLSIRQEVKLFHGWTIVIAALWIYAVAWGPGMCLGIFVKPIAEEFHWTRGTITGAFGLYMVVLGFLSIVGGIMVDRFGPRLTNLIGGFALGLGLFLISRINSLWQFYLCFSVLGGLGFAFIYVPLTATISRWFLKKKGLALGLLYSGGGIGGLVMSPLAQTWITQYGWRTSFAIVGIAVFCLIVPAALLLRKEPADLGLRPLGEEAATPGTESASRTKGRDYTVAEALKTGVFWTYGLSVVLMFAGIMMAQINMVPHATDRGIPEATAALALGIAAAFNAIGRLGMGAVSDRIGTKRALCSSMLLASAMLFWLMAVEEPWMLFLFAVPFGFAYGGVVPQNPRVIEGLFGTRSLGGIMGVSALLAVIGPGLGPVLGAMIYDHTGSYDLAFLVGGLCILAGFGLVLFLNLSGTQRALEQAPAPDTGPYEANL